MSGPPPAPDDRETPEVLRSLVDNTQLLVKKEIELAKLEVSEMIKARLIGVGAGVVAAVAALYLFAFAGVTAAKALELVVAPWLAWLIVTGVILLLIVVAGLLAARKFSTPPWKPERTIETVESTKQWAQRKVQS